MTMEFSVEFYTSETGRCPVREFLLELKDSDPGQAIASHDMAVARERMLDWQERNAT